MFLHLCYALTIPLTSTPKITVSNQQDKRSLLIGDLSYSYAATDIGSPEGSHIKTITVIKNVAVPKSGKPYSQHIDAQDWQKQVKNQFKIVMKLPDFPDIPPENFFKSNLKTNIKSDDHHRTSQNYRTSHEYRISHDQSNINHPTKNKEKLSSQNNISTKNPTTDDEVILGNYEDASYEEQAQQNMEHILAQNHRRPNKLQPAAMSLKQQNIPDQFEKQEDRSKVDVEKELESADVEFIQQLGNTQIQSDVAERSKEAQLQRSREQNPAPGHNLYSTSISNTQQLSSSSPLKSNSQKSSAVIEDFSDYSMHTVKHILDPVKATKQSQAITKYKVQFPSTVEATKEPQISQQQTYDTSKKTNAEKYATQSENPAQLQHSTASDPNKKSTYIAPYLRGPARKPYHSPSVENAYSTSSTTTQQPYLAPSKSRAPQTFYLLHPPSTTTQKPYLSPNVYKSYSLNKEQTQLEQRQLQAERDELEQQQQEFERQQLQEKKSYQKQYAELEIDERESQLPDDIPNAEPLQKSHDESTSVQIDLYTKQKKSSISLDDSSSNSWQTNNRNIKTAQLRQAKSYTDHFQETHEFEHLYEDDILEKKE